MHPVGDQPREQAALAGLVAESGDLLAAARALFAGECYVVSDHTRVGNPIVHASHEIEALTQAFRQTTGKRGFCRVGSVKSNIGHLDTAAGVTSLIKAVLTVKHGQIPPTLGFEKANPAIPFDTSPFVVADRLTPVGGPHRRPAPAQREPGQPAEDEPLAAHLRPVAADRRVPDADGEHLAQLGLPAQALVGPAAHPDHQVGCHPDLVVHALDGLEVHIGSEPHAGQGSPGPQLRQHGQSPLGRPSTTTAAAMATAVV